MRGCIAACLVSLWLFACCASLRAQCPARSSGAPMRSDQPGEPLLPEAGLLTDDTYTNLYFGFTLHLPISVSGHRLMVPITLPGEHALLAIGFQQNSRYGTLKITAGGRRDENHKNMTPEQAQQREDEMARGKGDATPTYRFDLTPPAVHLKRMERHSGEVHGTQYSARLRDYTVRFTIQTNDPAFLKKARESVSGLRVFCTDDAGRFLARDGRAFVPEGTPTTGPTIPTAVVDQAISARPAEHIPAGSVIRSSLQIPDLQFAYALPSGWTVVNVPEAEDEGRGDTLSERLLFLWKSCARTLLRASGGPNGAMHLELRALDQSCLALPFPASASDTLHAEALGEYLQMLGRFGEIASNRLVQAGGRPFVVYEGTVTEGHAAQNLENREVESIVVTRYNRLLYVWRWIAPTMSELRRVVGSQVQFGNGMAVAIGPEMSISRNSSQP